jgi:hypothetical protein
VEVETGLIVTANADNIYAIDTANEIVDFEEILDDRSIAEEAAENQGFKIWD